MLSIDLPRDYRRDSLFTSNPILDELELKIDAVITWVDGNDLNWQKKINKYLKVKKDFSKKTHRPEHIQWSKQAVK